MNKNVTNCKKSEFVPERTLRATVKAVNKTGVMVKMPCGRGAGVISSRCWGTGIEREDALAAIRPGDELDVIVRSYDARTMTLSLVLVGCEHLVASTKKESKKMVRQVARPQRAMYPCKPSFVPIAANTMLLWDASNLLGAAGAENAARTFAAISESMSEQGYKTMFFIERRCLTWALHNQRSTDEADELDAFARRGDVVIVGDGGNGTGEADSAILQMAEAMPGSVCVTRDRYEDYAHAYPGIVGTDRIRSFSVAKAGGKSMILVNGLAHAIVVEDAPPHVRATPSESPSQSTECCRPDVHSERDALLALGTAMLTKGNEKKGIACFAKAGAVNPLVWAELAWMYNDGTGVKADKSKARRFFRKAREMAAKNRQRRIRIARAHSRKNRLFDHATLRGCAA